jgi:hypothetical protein
MKTWLRRLFWLGLLSGAGVALYSALQRRHEPPPSMPAPSAAAPPMPASTPPAAQPTRPTVAESAPAAFAEVDDVTDVADQPTWVAPVDGRCPDGYMVKANSNSGIFHMPGGRFYERTVPERCYASAEDAEADGYRRAKA